MEFNALAEGYGVPVDALSAEKQARKENLQEISANANPQSTSINGGKVNAGTFSIGKPITASMKSFGPYGRPVSTKRGLQEISITEEIRDTPLAKRLAKRPQPPAYMYKNPSFVPTDLDEAKEIIKVLGAEIVHLSECVTDAMGYEGSQHALTVIFAETKSAIEYKEPPAPKRKATVGIRKIKATFTALCKDMFKVFQEVSDLPPMENNVDASSLSMLPFVEKVRELSTMFQPDTLGLAHSLALDLHNYSHCSDVFTHRKKGSKSSDDPPKLRPSDAPLDDLLYDLCTKQMDAGIEWNYKAGLSDLQNSSQGVKKFHRPDLEEAIPVGHYPKTIALLEQWAEEGRSSRSSYTIMLEQREKQAQIALFFAAR
ncbi:hypothetical protein EJ08DRAFT_691284 [Tothia fuscella]|uniref:Uncharacterized protein n=1 Tax=Tothia fuscella TaxID=1048955 RepID=A0A9P4P4Z9_9PEZI|nr:hypothetical protein EJ08DRAFT_691284 [Tothia fuscella]